MIGSSNDETNFTHKLLTDTQVSKVCRGFAKDLSVDIKFSKTQISKIVQLGGFLFSPPNIFGPPIPVKLIVDSIANSIKKELKDVDSKKTIIL